MIEFFQIKMKNNLGFNYVAKYNLLVKKRFLNIKL